MSPFNVKEALLAKHAQHVVLIHFPIALFMTGVAFDIMARWRKQVALATVAYYNFFVAALSTPLVIATGLLAWQLQLEGRKLKGILFEHLIFALAASLLIWLVWYLYFRSRRAQEQIPPSYCVSAELLGIILVAFTGHLGGFLSGVNGPG